MGTSFYIIPQIPRVEAAASFAAPYYLSSLNQAASGASRQLAAFVGSSDSVGSIRLGITTGSYLYLPSAAASSTTGTPSQATPGGAGYITVGQSPVGTIPTGTWVFNMTMQDTRAGGSAYVWITVFSCNQQDIGRSAPAAPACTFLLKNWDNTTNIKATTTPTSYTFSKASVPQFTGVQVLYVEYWVRYTVSGGDSNDLVTLNSGYGNNGAYIGFSVKTPGATYWPNITPSVQCSSTCAALSTSTGSASMTTSVTMASTAKYVARPTVTGSTTTGTPHFQGGTVIASGWEVLDTAFFGTNIAAGTWSASLRTQTSYPNPMTVDGHAVNPTGSGTCAPGVMGTCTISVTTTLTNDVIVLFVQCGLPGLLGSVTITDGSSLAWNTRVSWQQIGNRAQGEWWAVSSGALSSDTVTATFTQSQTACNLLYIAINGANTATPYDSNAAEPATVNGNSPTSCVMTTDNADVILFGEVGQTGTPVFTRPSGWTAGDTGGSFEKFDAWNIVAGSVTSQTETWAATAGINISGLCDAIVAAIPSPGTANLWVSVFSCNVPNLGAGQIILTSGSGQVAQTCSPVVKNWDNSTNIMATAWATRSYSFSGSAFSNAKYLYTEVWISYTSAAGTTPTVSFTVQDSSSSVSIPAGGTYYLTAQQISCSTSCQNLFYYVGAQSASTTVNVATNTGTYQVRPSTASATRGTASTSNPDGYAWITEGAINGTIGSGTWKFTMSLTDSATGGTAFLWFTVWNCARPNVGQAGAGCTLLFKNWDNSTNIKATAYSTNVYLTSQPAFGNVKYLAIEVWISETATSGASPDTVSFHMGNTESLVRLPGGANRFYYTSSAMACAVTCRFFSSSAGAADLTTRVTLGTTGGVQFEVRPYATSTTTAVISTNTVVGSGWESAVPLDVNITSGPWRFNVTMSNTVASGTGNLWLKVYSCPDSVVGSPPNCVFLFKFYDNSTNLLAVTPSTKYSFTTPSKPLFHNVQYLYVEYWLNYPTAGTGDTITFTTVSSASSVETPQRTGAGLVSLQVDSGKVIDSAAGQQQLRISTANKNSLIYLTMSQATSVVGFTFVTDNANLTWILRSVKIGSSDIVYGFYAIAGNLLQGDVVTVGTGIAAQAAMSITIISGENTATPFDSSGSLVGVTRSTFSTPACTTSSCTLPAAANVAQNNLLVAALMYTVASGTCNTFTSASDTLGSTLSVVATSSEVLAGSCAENVIVAGYSGGSGSDTVTINFNTGTSPANQRAELFELLGVSNTVAGTSTGANSGSTMVSTSGSVSYNTNDFMVAAWTGLAGVTTLTAGGGFTVFSANFRSDGEYQSAVSSGSTNFPMTVAPSMAWAEAGVVFKAQSSSQPSITIGTSAAPNTQLTTSHSNDIVIGVVDARLTTSPTQGPGFTLVAVPVATPTTITMGIEDARFTPPKTLVPVNFTLSSSAAWIMVGDAIQGPVVRLPTDTYMTSDSVARSLVLSRIPADAFASADSPARSVSLPRSSADSFSLADGPARAVVLSRAPSDSTPFSEAAARFAALGRSVSDSYASLDSAARSLALGRTATDPYGFIESAFGNVILPRPSSDSFPFLEAAVRFPAFGRSASDSYGFLESVLGSMALARTTSDAYGFLESALSNVVLGRAAADLAAVSDLVDRLAQFTRNASDGSGFLDLASAALNLGRSAADSFGLSELVNRLIALQKDALDTFGLFDVPMQSSSFVRAAADSFNFFETALRNLLFSRSASDSFGFAELVQTLVQVARFPGDFFGYTDLPSRVLVLARNAFDTFTFNGFFLKFKDLFVAVHDSFIFGQNLSREVGLIRDVLDQLALMTVASAVRNLLVGISDIFRLLDSLLHTIHTTTPPTSTTPGGGFLSRYGTVVFFFLPLLILLLILLLAALAYLRARDREREKASPTPTSA